MESKPLPLGTDVVGAVRKPLREASTLPGELFFSEQTFSAELDRIFSKMWICVGREADLPASGSFFTREVGPECVLLTRDHQGTIHALYNVCRHRGARLVTEPAGESKQIRCRYHGWTYGLDGRLLGAPLMESSVGFSRENYPVLPVRLEAWEGFLFINLDPDARPLSRQMEGFPDLSRFQLPFLRRGARKVYEVRANWKLLGENYGECYHCAIAHPQLNRISHYLSGGRETSGPNFTGGPMTLNEGCTTMTMSGRTERPPIPNLNPEDHREIHYFHLYPNFLLSLHPDYVMTHTIWAQAPTQTHVICEWLFPQGAVEAEGFDPSDAVEFWDLTNRQDWELCELTQKGVQSRGYRPGRYQGIEGSVHAFDNWYLDSMNHQPLSGRARH